MFDAYDRQGGVEVVDRFNAGSTHTEKLEKLCLNCLILVVPLEYFVPSLPILGVLAVAHSNLPAQ